MAKKSQVNRDNRRKKLITKYAARRAELRKVLQDQDASIDYYEKQFTQDRALIEQ